MRLTHLAIKNYKSLREVEIKPAEFSVLIGRNSSGKSNFADALEFVSLAYTDGLEHAVARKGGYENIAHRKERRSRSAIEFAIELKGEVNEEELLRPGLPRFRVGRGAVPLTFRHSFSFQSSGEGIRSDFKVVKESLEIILESAEQADLISSARKYQWLNIQRASKKSIVVLGDTSSPLARAVLFDPKYWTGDAGQDFPLSSSELLFVLPFFRPRVVGQFIALVRNLGIFQLSPDVSRHPGVPTPNPHLSARGENLPAVVDWLQRHRQKEWKNVLTSMRGIVPELSDITVEYLHTRTLGLFFHEKGIGRAWTAEEVSDGTIRALGMLVACFDPRITALLIEEPENSLHPWIIKELIRQLRSLSKEKMVLVTSHSPVVIDMLQPSEVWVIYKKGGETSLRPLVEFDPALVDDWTSGKYRLFEYLESGYVSEAVPSGGV